MIKITTLQSFPWKSLVEEFHKTLIILLFSFLPLENALELCVREMKNLF